MFYKFETKSKENKVTVVGVMKTLLTKSDVGIVIKLVTLLSGYTARYYQGKRVNPPFTSSKQGSPS